MDAISRTINAHLNDPLPAPEVLVCKRIFQSLDGDSDGLLNKELLAQSILWQRLPCHSLVDRQNAPEVLIRNLAEDNAGNSSARQFVDLFQLIWNKSRPDYYKIAYYLKNECYQLTQIEESRSRDIFDDLVSSQDEGAFDFIPLQSTEMIALCGMGSIDLILGTDVAHEQCDTEFSEAQWLALCLAIKRHNGCDYLSAFLSKAQATVGLTCVQSRQVLCIYNSLDPHNSGAVNYRRLLLLSPETFTKMHSTSPLPNISGLPEVATSTWPVSREEFVIFFEKMKRARGPTWLQLTLDALISIPEIEQAYAQFEQRNLTAHNPGVLSPGPRGCASARGCNPAGKCIVA